MAKRAGKSSGGLPPGIVPFLVLLLALVVTAGGTAVVTWSLAQDSADESADAELQGSHAVLRLLQQQRYQQLRYISRLFATDQLLTGYLADAAQERDLISLLDAIEEYQNLLNFELAVVLDRNGRVLTRTDDPDASGEDLSTTPLVAVALEEQEAFGVWRQNQRLYHAVAVPLVRQFDLVGYIIAAFPINDAVALQVQRTSGADTVFLANSGTGPAVVASTLPADRAEELVSALRLAGEALDKVTQRGETVDKVPVSLDSGSAMAFLAPLYDASQKAIGASVSVTLLDQRRARFMRIMVMLAALGLASALVGFVVLMAIGRQSAAPTRRLAAAARQAADGNLEVVVPVEGSGPLAEIGRSLSSLLGGLREKMAAEFVVGRVVRYLPEPARFGAIRQPEAVSLCLVGVEMRRFANPKLGYDPEENLGRFARDLRRIGTAAASYKGRVEAVSGHRALVVFEGESSPARALSAATEILLLLSERESVFDEPEPPAVALTGGAMVCGSVVWGDRPGTVVAGVPAQQLEGLLREATAGVLYFTHEIYQQIGGLFQRAGVQVKAQKSVLGPKPLLVITAEEAAKATGVTTARASASMTEGRSLTDLVPGSVLGSRFDVLAELGAGPSGVVLKARDRELGDLVTLKMLRPEVVADSEHFEKLRGVIRISRGIQHPNVLQVLDFGEADGMPYISMEFVRAMTLRQTLDQCRQIPVVAALRMSRELAAGLLAGHNERLLHRGVKPQNVLIEPAGSLKIMDFGLTAPPRPGAVLEGLGYMAPERLAGQAANDPRGDVYAWGAVVYEMLTGQPPYTGASPVEVSQRMAAQPAAPPSSVVPDLPPAFEAVILKAMEPNVEGRFGSFVELVEALDGVRV